MTTLILGHEYQYNKTGLRCSPINPDLWYDKPYTCVDHHCNNDETDIVYDLFSSIDYRFTSENDWIKAKKDGIKYDGHWVWKFAEDNSYDTIIDCMGSITWDRSLNQYKFQDELLKTLLRVLKINGKFYCSFGIYEKINETTLDFIKKERNGYELID